MEGQGKVKSALRFVSDISKGGVLSLDQTVPDNGPLQVRDVLRSKHPSAKTIHPSKTWLIVKEEFYDEAMDTFETTDIEITVNGKRHLRAAIGKRSFVEEYVTKKVEEWVDQVHRLSTIAPHAAYAAYTHGLTSRWPFGPYPTSITSWKKQYIRSSFPTGQPTFNLKVREVLSLPVRLGGLGISIPSESASSEFSTSEKVTAPLVTLITDQEPRYNVDYEKLKEIKAKIRSDKAQNQTSRLTDLRKDLSPSLKRALDLAEEKGASTWLTVLPIEEYGFALHKGAFRDALSLRYAWHIPHQPETCACGKSFDVNHAMICPKGGFPIIRHNEVRDITADLLTEICHDVELEPTLQPLTGERLSHRTANTEDGARLDVKARGFWDRMQCAFFDIGFFTPTH